MSLGDRILGPLVWARARERVRAKLGSYITVAAVLVLGASYGARALGYPDVADAISALARNLGLDPLSAGITALVSAMTLAGVTTASASIKAFNEWRKITGEPLLPEPAAEPAPQPQFLALYNALTAEGVPPDAAGRAARKALGL